MATAGIVPEMQLESLKVERPQPNGVREEAPCREGTPRRIMPEPRETLNLGKVS